MLTWSPKKSRWNSLHLRFTRGRFGWVGRVARTGTGSPSVLHKKVCYNVRCQLSVGLRVLMCPSHDIGFQGKLQGCSYQVTSGLQVNPSLSTRPFGYRALGAHGHERHCRRKNKFVLLWPGDGTVDAEGAGVCPGALPVEADCREDGSRPSPRGDDIATPLLPAPGAHISSDRSRQRRNRRKNQRWIARRAAATADSFLT